MTEGVADIGLKKHLSFDKYISQNIFLVVREYVVANSLPSHI